MEKLHHRLYKALAEHLTDISEDPLKNQALFTQALVFSPDCILSNLATELVVDGQRESLIQRLRRWLRAESVSPKCCYLPLVKHLLMSWTGVELNLVMDRTDLENRTSVLMLSVAYKHRCLPLAWQVLTFGSTKQEVQIELLEEVREFIERLKDVRVTFYGDAEFCAIDVQKYCQKQGWHWWLGIKSDILYHNGDGDWRNLASLGLEFGQRRYLNNVILTRQHSFGPVHIIGDWTKRHDAARYYVSDQIVNRLTWRHGRKRFWIEPSFRDYKGYGFDLEKSRITDTNCLNRLILAMATTSLWLIHIGQWLIHSERRYLLEANHKRDYSLFRLGRDYAHRSRVKNWPLPIGFNVLH